MAEPLPKDVGSSTERRARMLWGRNMFAIGCICGALVGVGITLSITSELHEVGMAIGLPFLILLWFLMSRGGIRK